MKEQRIIIFIVLIINFIPSLAQTKKQWMKAADVYYEKQDFYGASIYYRNAMLEDSSDMHVVYRYAESLRQYNEYEKAAYYYQYVLNEDKKNEFKECRFWLATMQKYNAQYTDALKNFTQFKKTLTDKKSYLFLKTDQEIKSCKFVKNYYQSNLHKHVYTFYKKNISKKESSLFLHNIADTTDTSKSVNTVNTDFSPTLLNDSTLLYASLRSDKMRSRSIKGDSSYFLKLYLATKQDTLWNFTETFDSLFNEPNTHTANACLNYTKDKIYFSRCTPNGKCKIWTTQLQNNEWQKATPLPEKINTPDYTTTQPFSTFINGTERLFFVSDRSGGLGKLDIWETSLKPDGYTEPKNLGKYINTYDDDISPFYDTLYHKLYFSSPWHEGFGGQDIFSSIETDSGFGKSINIGIPFNSSANDLYFSINTTTKSGFLVSNRKGAVYYKSETCCNDIWAFRLVDPPADTTVFPKPLTQLEKLLSYLPVKLYFHNDEPNPRTRDTISTKSYRQSYEEYINLRDEYRANYLGQIQDTLQQKITLDTLDNFFEEHVIKGMNNLELFTQALLSELEKGHKLDLMVKGHASALAKTDYNVPLTLRRISSLELYLREYQGGVIVPYLEDSARNGGSLKMIRLPFGEYKARKNLSDNLYDKRNSVYSVAAAEHRNIEIVSVTLSHKDSLHPEMRFLRKVVADFGASSEGQVLTHRFKFKNSGKSPLLISSIKTDCACITVSGPTTSILPGELGEIEVAFDTKGLKGKEVHHIELYTNGVPAMKEISVTTEVK